MSRAEPKEPSVFPTEVTAKEVRDRTVLVDSPRGKLALIADRPSCPEQAPSPERNSKSSTIVAIDAWCPHIDGPLWEGSATDGEVSCPWHRWRFSLESGRCTWAPAGDAEEAAETEIQVFQTQEEANGCLTIILRPSTEAEVGSE